ncbi:hypothetical protein ILYODFUR_038672 [Ilyodon furcidens]|uniref:Uncharacterized protein n=1 Tax=Ilyodon furcidens TaxID=33524 RepID=A0ABV0T3S2_9TELE
MYFILKNPHGRLLPACEAAAVRGRPPFLLRSNRRSNSVVMLINENGSSISVTTPNVTVDGPALHRSPSNYGTTLIFCSVPVRLAPTGSTSVPLAHAFFRL